MKKNNIDTYPLDYFLTLTLIACAGSVQTGTQAASVTLTEKYTHAAPAKTQLILGARIRS